MPLSNPPRENGLVVPHNHPEITAEDRIIRRISEEHFVPDQKLNGNKRLSRMAFQASSHGNRGMSVDVERSITAAGLDAREFVTNPKFMCSVWFEAGFLRSQCLLVGYDPLPDNPHHGEVWGRFSKGLQTKLLKAAEWFVPNNNVTLHI